MSSQKADVARHVQRVHVRVEEAGGKTYHKCEQCPAGYSRKNMLAQHVKLVHAPKQDEGTRGRVERADDLGDDVGDDLGDEKGSAGSNHYIYGIEGDDRSGEEDDGDGEFAAKEKELADKEAELRDYERIVEQSEEEAAKARENLLRGLTTKYEYLCQKVGPEEAQRLFQKVTKECQVANVNKPQ